VTGKNCILEVKNLSKSYGGIKAVDNVSFKLYEGEVLAVLGDNGAGKSTLLKIISGAITADRGEIFVNQKKVKIESPIDSIKLGIEMVYQDLALINSLNVYQNLFLGREIIKRVGPFKLLDKKRMRAITNELLKSTGIHLENVEKNVSDLSGGQRQSIVISKAIHWGNKIIILDEPTAALGVKESNEVLKLIKSVSTKGISEIIITHNMKQAFSVADRIMVLHLGQVVGIKKKNETNVDEIVKMITGGVFIDA
jgi:ABC-type sugar transport system ATPase subunit